MKKTYSLRLLDKPEDIPTHYLPVVKRGSPATLWKWATDRGWEWKRDQSVHGGRFVDPKTGNCLLVY